MKPLKKISIALISAAALCTFASILFSVIRYEELNELLGQMACVLSVISIGVIFALMNGNDDEQCSVQTDINGGNADTNDVEDKINIFDEYVIYDDSAEQKDDE